MAIDFRSLALPSVYGVISIVDFKRFCAIPVCAYAKGTQQRNIVLLPTRGTKRTLLAVLCCNVLYCAVCTLGRGFYEQFKEGN